MSKYCCGLCIVVFDDILLNLGITKNVHFEISGMKGWIYSPFSNCFQNYLDTIVTVNGAYIC